MNAPTRDNGFFTETLASRGPWLRNWGVSATRSS